MEQSTQTLRHRAAMYAAISSGVTRISRSGFSVIFSEPVFGQHDLSPMPQVATGQLQAAGLDIDTVTDQQISEYRAWEDQAREQWEQDMEARRINGRRILITRPFSAPNEPAPGTSAVMMNGIYCLDGQNEWVDGGAVEVEEYWDPSAKNLMHGTGAFRMRPNYDQINAVVAELRERHPEFADAQIQDNNGTGHAKI
ncbi:MAG: hypothetical protein CMI02_14960 [Oceanospirillaceae bacterium]|nr:hypothetical protein [Oceanospirillaceae bacterium]